MRKKIVTENTNINRMSIHSSDPLGGYSIEVKKEGAKKTFKTIGKSVFWILLGGLIPMFAGGFIKKYQIRLVVAAASAFAMQCISATLWKQSYQIPTWQPVFIVVLGIIGIGIAAGIPHLVKVVSEKK